MYFIGTGALYLLNHGLCLTKVYKSLNVKIKRMDSAVTLWMSSDCGVGFCG